MRFDEIIISYDFTKSEDQDEHNHFCGLVCR